MKQASLDRYLCINAFHMADEQMRTTIKHLSDDGIVLAAEIFESKRKELWTLLQQVKSGEVDTIVLTSTSDEGA